jgi:hypothetical protein
LYPASPTVPRHAGNSTANSAWDPAMCSRTSPSSTPRPLRTFARLHTLTAMPTGAGTVSRTTTARDSRSARSPLKHSGGFVTMFDMQCISLRSHLLPSPGQGTSVPPASPIRITSYLWCSAIICPACLLLLRGSTLPARVPAGSGACPSPPRRFCTAGMQALPWVRPAVLVQGLRVGCFLFSSVRFSDGILSLSSFRLCWMHESLRFEWIRRCSMT